MMALLRDQMRQALAKKNRQNQQAPGYRQLEAGAAPQPAGPGPQGPEQTNAAPEEQAAYEKVVLSGMKVLYDEATHDAVMEFLDASDPATSMARLASMLVIEIDNRNEGRVPETVILPAAMELMDAITELAEVSGTFEVTPDVAENATHILVTTLGEHYGVDPEEMKAFLQQTVPAQQLGQAAQEAAQNPARWRPFKDAPADAQAQAQPAPEEEEEEVA